MIAFANAPFPPRLIQLPSGQMINLSLVIRTAPADDTLEIYFAGGDKALLTGQDVEAFRRNSGWSGSFSSNVRVAIFWLVIASAVFMMYLLFRSRA